MIGNLNLRQKRNKIGLREFNAKRNKILILRKEGGFGDILMYRMIFEDIKKTFPEHKIIFACPEQYIPLVNDHPYIDSVIDVNKVNVDDYLYYYDTILGETKHNIHKSDIWAEYCGIKLKNHNMHMKAMDKTKGRTLLLAPFSAMPSKSLNIKAINEIIKKYKEYNVIIVHNKPIKDVDVIYDLNIKQLFALFDTVDCVISVDTFHLHIAGGLNKPTLGLFGWTNGELFCKYYKSVKPIQFGEITDMEPANTNYLSECFNQKNLSF